MSEALDIATRDCLCGRPGCRCTLCDGGLIESELRAGTFRPCPVCRPGAAEAARYARTPAELGERLRRRGIAAEIAAEREARRLRAAARRSAEAEQRSRVRMAS